MDASATRDLRARLRGIRRRRAAFGAVCAALPFALLAFYRAPWTSNVRTGVLLAWVAAYAGLAIGVAWSRCPRCRALFFVGPGLTRVNPLQSRCGGCGGPLAESASPEGG